MDDFVFCLCLHFPFLFNFCDHWSMMFIVQRRSTISFLNKDSSAKMWAKHGWRTWRLVFHLRFRKLILFRSFPHPLPCAFILPGAEGRYKNSICSSSPYPLFVCYFLMPYHPSMLSTTGMVFRSCIVLTSSFLPLLHYRILFHLHFLHWPLLCWLV